MPPEIRTPSPWERPITVKQRTLRMNASSGIDASEETVTVTAGDFYPLDGDEVAALEEGNRSGAQYYALIPLDDVSDVGLDDVIVVGGTEYTVRERKPWGNYLQCRVVVPQ